MLDWEPADQFIDDASEGSLKRAHDDQLELSQLKRTKSSMFQFSCGARRSAWSHMCRTRCVLVDGQKQRLKQKTIRVSAWEENARRHGFPELAYYDPLVPFFTSVDDISISEGVRYFGFMDVDAPLQPSSKEAFCKAMFSWTPPQTRRLRGLHRANEEFREALNATEDICAQLNHAGVPFVAYYTGFKGFRILAASVQLFLLVAQQGVRRRQCVGRFPLWAFCVPRQHCHAGYCHLQVQLRHEVRHAPAPCHWICTAASSLIRMPLRTAGTRSCLLCSP